MIGKASKTVYFEALENRTRSGGLHADRVTGSTRGSRIVIVVIVVVVVETLLFSIEPRLVHEQDLPGNKEMLRFAQCQVVVCFTQGLVQFRRRHQQRSTRAFGNLVEKCHTGDGTLGTHVLLGQFALDFSQAGERYGKIAKVEPRNQVGVVDDRRAVTGGSNRRIVIQDGRRAKGIGMDSVVPGFQKELGVFGPQQRGKNDSGAAPERMPAEDDFVPALDQGKQIRFDLVEDLPRRDQDALVAPNVVVAVVVVVFQQDSFVAADDLHGFVVGSRHDEVWDGCLYFHANLVGGGIVVDYEGHRVSATIRQQVPEGGCPSQAYDDSTLRWRCGNVMCDSPWSNVHQLVMEESEIPLFQLLLERLEAAKKEMQTRSVRC